MAPLILLVEDDVLNCESTSRFLTYEGFRVITAVDGVQAVTMAQAHMPDLILMDMGLPVLNGWQATQQLKAAPETRDIPIVALTAYAMAEDRERAFMVGCDDYETKPVIFTRLKTKIRALTDIAMADPDPEMEVNSQTIKKQQTVLIMDDDPGMQMVLETALREAGYQVVLANDGQEGIEKLRSLKPDLVISDIMMPQMDGIETFQRIKEQLEDDGIPIFIMTALNRKPWFADLEAEGAVILQKPFEIDQFLQLVNDMLDDGELLSLLKAVATTGEQTLVLISTSHAPVDMKTLILEKVIFLPNAHYIFPTSESEAVAIVSTAGVEETIYTMVESFYERLSSTNEEARLSFSWSSGPDVSINTLIEDVAQELVERRESQGITITRTPDILQYQPGRSNLEQRYDQARIQLTELKRRFNVNQFIREDQLRSEIEQMTAVFNHDLTGGLGALRDAIARVSAQAHTLPFDFQQLISRMRQHVQICVAWQRSVMELGSGKALQFQNVDLATFLKDTLLMVKEHFNLSIQIHVGLPVPTSVSIDTEAMLVTCVHYLVAAQLAGAQNLHVGIERHSGPSSFTIIFQDDGMAMQRELALNAHSPFMLNSQQQMPIRVLAILPRMLAQQNIGLKTRTNDSALLVVLDRSADEVVVSIDKLHQRIIAITKQITDIEAQIETAVARQQRSAVNARDILAPYIHEIERHVDAIAVESEPLQSLDPIDPVESQRIRRLSLYCYLLVRNITLALQGTTLPVETVDINEQIRQVIEILEHKLAYVHISLHLAQPAPIVSIASVEIKQLLMNVIKNAAEATKSGGRISITTQTDSDRVIISIQDTGIGIHPKHRNDIFKLHFSTKGRGKNSGVGLYAVAAIVQRAGGCIRIASAYREGDRIQSWRRGFRRPLHWRSTGTLIEIELTTANKGTNYAEASSYTHS
jgi:two-component system OmpR family response regulator